MESRFINLFDKLFTIEAMDITYYHILMNIMGKYITRYGRFIHISQKMFREQMMDEYESLKEFGYIAWTSDHMGDRGIQSGCTFNVSEDATGGRRVSYICKNGQTKIRVRYEDGRREVI